jgi:predicted RNase H-like HicB family nuclease
LGDLPGGAGCNGQGETVEEAKTSLRDAIRLIFEDRIDDFRRSLPEDVGVKLGKPQSINVNDWTGWSGWSPQGWGGGGGGGAYQNVSQNFGGTSGENNPTVAIGQISVSANVSVSLLIE